MSKSYNGVTRTLELGNTSYRSVIFLPSKPPLDSELNFLDDLPHSLHLETARAAYQSGFFPNAGALTQGYDNTGMDYGVNFTTTPNVFIMRNPKGVPFKVNIFGEVLDVGGSFSSDPSQLVVTLPPAIASGSREDLVFLEVWYQEVDSQSAANKPNSTHVYTFGNLDSGLPPTADDMYFSAIGTVTTNRVQLQYRLRVVGGVNFGAHPDGIDDHVNVFAQCGNFSASSFTYAKHATDSGLYVAGDGSGVARAALGSVDGFAYAIPLFRIHRRNTTPFSLLNLNGAGVSVLAGNSDRPDGFFYDKIEKYDVEDLRHFIPIDRNADELLEGAFIALLEGNLNTVLTESTLGAGQSFNGLGLQIDGIEAFDQTGVFDVAQPNGQRRVVNDALSIQKTTEVVRLSDRTSVHGANWTATDQFVVSLLGSNPLGTVFGNGAPTLKTVVRTLGVESVVSIPITVTPVGSTTWLVTLDSIPSGVTNQALNFDFEISYPPGNGLQYVPYQMLKVYEVRDNVNYSFVSENSLTGIRMNSLVASASANDYLIGLNENFGFTTLGFQAMSGDGTQSYTAPATYGSVPITHVHYVIVSGTLITRTTAPLNIQDVRRNFDNTITVIFNQAVPINTPMMFAVGLANNAVKIQEKTKGVTEISQVQILTKTILAGQNVTTVVFAAPDFVYSAQSEESGYGTYQSTCYVNNDIVACTTTLDGSFVTVDLPYAVGVGTNDTVDIVVNVARPLDPDQRLYFYYSFVPYQGVTSRLSFGNGPNSYVNTKLIAKAPGFLVHTSGTNGTNSTVPSTYAPISVKLPKAFTDKDADLANGPLGARIFPFHEGISLGADFTWNGIFAPNSFETLQGWVSDNADTTTPVSDNTRKMFGNNTVRFNKNGTSGTLGEMHKVPASTNWSTIINTSGNVVAGKQLVYWYYIPDSSLVSAVGLHLKTSGGDHIYKVVGGFETGWNKAVFTARNDGTATTTTVTQVHFVAETFASSTVLYGFSFVPPYIEDVGSSGPVRDGDMWYSNKDQTLVKYAQLVGMNVVSDGLGVNYFKDRAYSFDLPIVSGVDVATSTRISPYALGKTNFLSKNGITNDRGTWIGSNFYNVGAEIIANTKKQAVMYLLEQVIEDPTGNFAHGEFVLRVETKISDGTLVEISNSDFTSTNSFDLFRIVGRPLGKL